VVPTVFQLIALWVLMAYPQMGAPAQAPARVETRSPHGKLDIPCQNCHTFSGWKPVRSIPEFDHNKTRYPLRGMHTSVGCTDCHTKPVFTNVSNKCADCHADLHRGQFGSRCEACHTVKGWLVSLQSIREHQNRFPLVGAHSVAQCADCHKGAATGQFQGLSTQCATCHMPDYQRATVPNHVALRFPTDCQGCHNSMDTWLGAKFDHGRFTGFVLTGSHSTLDCASCHVGGRYQGTPADCVGCHARDYSSATNPNHVQANFPKSCAMCHTTGGWSPASFDHAAVTGYALTGAHTSLGCTQCHANGNYTNTSASCSSCHMKDYNGTTNPNHVSAGLPTDCAVCHSTTSWAGATFNHANTGFPLTGAHTPLNCSSCHANNVFTGLSPTCASCHLTNYNQTTNPNHVAAALPQTCQTCHSTTAWTPASFDHAAVTGYALTGAHTSLGCTQCHANGNYAITSTSCSSCHMKDYNGTTNPNHVSAGLPTDCTVCHSTTSWAGATFNHASTGFPLTGAHTPLNCSSCHANNIFSGLSPTCVSCHLKNYNQTTNPNHVAAALPQTCQVCHSTTAWTPATFNHNNTSFPLTGAHTRVACANCHVNNQYAGTPKDCYSCHRPDYQGTTNPNHVAAGFPTTCTTCHNTTAWTGATFSHTWFPIYSGAHQGKWTTCGDCHTNSSNYAAFSCITCHAHDKATTDSHHREVHNYVYNSANCYSCHPAGRAD